MSLAFLFPGQGAQTIGMGRDLAEASPAARAGFDEVDEALGEKLSRLIWEGIVPYTVIRVVYAGIVCLPLLFSSEKQIRIFGVIITLSVIAGFAFAQYAFTSVWCFMAAIVSGYILVAMRSVSRRGVQHEAEAV